jgi:conserved oligomeric Golgi complex subunit 1
MISVSQIAPESSNQGHDAFNSAVEFVARTQILFAALLPPPPIDTGPVTQAGEKLTVLLPYGIPLVDQQFQPAIQVAKPTSRFGLLLVGHETT